MKMQGDAAFLCIVLFWGGGLVRLPIKWIPTPPHGRRFQLRALNDLQRKYKGNTKEIAMAKSWISSQDTSSNEEL